MTADLTTFRTRFPEFAQTADSIVELALSDAKLLHARCPTATLFLAAHLLTLDQDETATGVDGGNGEASNMSDGSESISFVTQAETGQEAFYTTTKYGRRFLALEKRCIGKRFSVRVY